MKISGSIQSLLTALVISSASVICLCAQEPEHLPGQARIGAGLGGLGAGPVMTVLTDEQRGSFRQIMEGQRETMRETENKLRVARKKMVDASLAIPFDESMVRQQAQVLAGLEAEFSVWRAKALSQVQPALSAEQIAKIKNVMMSPGRVADRYRVLGERVHNLTTTNRDANDLPPKK